MRGVVLLVAFLWAGLAFAADETVFKDWRILCVYDGTEQSCQMLQSQPAIAGGADLFLLSLNQSEDTDDIVAVVSVPLGVYLAPGVEIHISDRAPFKVLYEICDQASCHAGFKVEGSVLASFKQGVEATFRVWTTKSKAVEFPVSLHGFSSGYAKLVSLGER